MVFWILILLLINGAASFAYTAATASDPATVWGLLAVAFVYTLGITQSGMAISAVMRLSKSGWGKYFSRIGEILTLSFIPVAVIVFIVIYAGGMEHLFYWASGAAAHGHHKAPLIPWLSKKLFLCRYVITMPLFYVCGYIFYRTGRAEESCDSHSCARSEKFRNVMAALVCVTYVIANTNVAWDFGMMIIEHWESSIFPPYYWAGNLVAGTAFVYLASRIFIKLPPGEHYPERFLDGIGKLFVGFVLLWVYMFWSQFIVFWYGNVPERMTPLFKTMTGNYFWPFAVMLLTIFIIPFISLLFRRIKLSVNGLIYLAISLCIGIWLNRYLMIVPVFNDGNEPIIASWAGVSLIAAGVAAILLSVTVFLKLFPKVTLTTGDGGGGH